MPRTAQPTIAVLPDDGDLRRSDANPTRTISTTEFMSEGGSFPVTHVRKPASLSLAHGRLSSIDSDSIERKVVEPLSTESEAALEYVLGWDGCVGQLMCASCGGALSDSKSCATGWKKRWHP